jgi:hypothetical protein
VSKKLDKCVEAFNELETQRTEVLAELEQWSLSRLSFRPASDAWSAIEVLDHIVRSETGIQAAVKRGLQNPQVLRLTDRLRVAALERALRSDQTFPVPRGAASTYPDTRVTFPEVTSRWKQSRIELRSLLDGLSTSDTSGGVFRHPFAGWMTIVEVFGNLSAHLYHHRFQLARLQASWADLHSK